VRNEWKLLKSDLPPALYAYMVQPSTILNVDPTSSLLLLSYALHGVHIVFVYNKSSAPESAYMHHWTVWQLVFFFFFPISFILCSYTFIGLIALALACCIVYCPTSPLLIGDSMPLCFPLVFSHELHSVDTVFLFSCFVNHVPYIHTYECVRHWLPIDYLCTCYCSWM